jgi:hypothetical protein
VNLTEQEHVGMTEQERQNHFILKKLQLYSKNIFGFRV